MNKRELAKISALLDKPGNVFVPLSIYLNKR
jgi:tmRNA-binding protein